MKIPSFSSIILSLLLLPFVTSCVTSEGYDESKHANFEALWSIFDKHYCFFDVKAQEYGLDWNEVHMRYRHQVTEDMTDQAFFKVCSNMVRELRDGHCNLVSGRDIASYTDWYENYPANYSDSLERKYLGGNLEYMQTVGLRYRVIEPNIGYIRCPSFNVDMGDGNLHYILDYLGTCDALIIDVRNNGGGMLTSAATLAGAFTNEKKTVGFIRHKTGPGHQDFSAPVAIDVTPATGLRWQKPVVVLANRRTFSAANAFVMYMKILGATIIGDRTGGGSGMPFSSEIPLGWGVRFSACPMTDLYGNSVEFGIDPDIHVDITDADYQRSVDTIIESARDFLYTQIKDRY